MLYDRRVDEKDSYYFNLNVCDSGAKVVLHMHNSIELKFILQGEYSATVAGKKILCKKGDVLFINSRQPHYYESVGESVNFVLIFDKEIFRAVCSKGKVLPLVFNLGEDFERISALLHETHKKWQDMSMDSKRGFVFRLLGDLTQNTELINDVVVKEDVAVKIIEYIKEHCNENITLEVLSKQFGYTRNYFSTLLNNRMNMGIRECVNRFRIERAVQMMYFDKEKLPLSTVAERCGYESMNTFYRAYKKYADDLVVKGK